MRIMICVGVAILASVVGAGQASAQYPSYGGHGYGHGQVVHHDHHYVLEFNHTHRISLHPLAMETPTHPVTATRFRCLSTKFLSTPSRRYRRTIRTTITVGRSIRTTVGTQGTICRDITN